MEFPVDFSKMSIINIMMRVLSVLWWEYKKASEQWQSVISTHIATLLAFNIILLDKMFSVNLIRFMFC